MLRRWAGKYTFDLPVDSQRSPLTTTEPGTGNPTTETATSQPSGAPAAQARRRGSTHWPALDGLRGLAAIYVFLYHVNWTPAAGGFLGVDVFFVLSGFLVTVPLIRESREEGAFSVRRFLGRRVLRLVPALLVLYAFLGIWIATHPHISRVHETLNTMPWLLVGISNWAQV